MSLLVLTLVLAQAPAPPSQTRATAAEKAERAFFDQVSVSLSLDHAVYHVGEPVRLKISMRNGGSTPVRGYLDVLPSSEMTEIYYRRRNGTFRRFLVEMPNAEAVNVQFVSQPLDPGS